MKSNFPSNLQNFDFSMMPPSILGHLSFQPLGNDQYGVSFTLNAQRQIQRMGAGRKRRFVGGSELERKMSQNGRGHHGKIEILQV